MHSLQGEDQAGFFPVHARLETALVEGLAHRADATARPAPCDRSCAALWTPLISECGWVKGRGRHTKNAAAAMPVPHASTDAIVVLWEGTGLSGEKMSWVKIESRLQALFSEPTDDGLGRPAAVATPAAGDPPCRLIGCLSGFPRQNFEKLLGDRFL